jgi:hypothetical protein
VLSIHKKFRTAGDLGAGEHVRQSNVVRFRVKTRRCDGEANREQSERSSDSALSTRASERIPIRLIGVRPIGTSSSRTYDLTSLSPTRRPINNGFVSHPGSFERPLARRCSNACHRQPLQRPADVGQTCCPRSIIAPTNQTGGRSASGSRLHDGQRSLRRERLGDDRGVRRKVTGLGQLLPRGDDKRARLASVCGSTTRGRYRLGLPASRRR